MSAPEYSLASAIELPIFDPQFKADPYPLYGALRTQGSVVPVRLPSGLRVWLVTCHATARTLLGDRRLSKLPPPSVAKGKPTFSVTHPLFDHLLTADPPRHGQLRSVLVPHFSSRRLREFRPRLQVIVDDLLDAMARHEEGDLLADFATPLAFAAVCELVGVPRPERGSLARALQDLETADFDMPERVPEIAQTIFETLVNMSRSKRERSCEDLLSSLTAAADCGALEARQVPALAFLILAAGRETTTNLIGSSVFRLLGEPPTWARLCAKPQRAALLVEELLRLESPLEMATARHATEALDVDGSMIRAGDVVFVGLAAANRDPACFEAPDQFLPLRNTTPRHLAFGHGIHVCIGAGLARIEGELALTGLCRKFPALRLTKPPSDCTWKPGLITRGLQNLPVRWAPD